MMACIIFANKKPYLDHRAEIGSRGEKEKEI
jgi:hypothetical protein